jgi:hypothetical protein
MRGLVYLFLLLFNPILVPAADLNPPNWRGTDGSTFQQWEFRFDQSVKPSNSSLACYEKNLNKTPWGQQAAPDQLTNPYQQKTGICVEFKSLWSITKDLDWLLEYNGRDGVWKLESEGTFANFLNFIVPNAATKDDTSTLIQLQLEYFGSSGAPVIGVHYPAGALAGYIPLIPIEEDPNTGLPDGWSHYRAMFKADGCPRFESVFIYPPEQGEAHIDSVIIDTVCLQNRDQNMPPET